MNTVYVNYSQYILLFFQYNLHHSDIFHNLLQIETQA